MEHGWTNHCVQNESVLHFVSLGHRHARGREGGATVLISYKDYVMLSGSCFSLQTLFRGHSQICGPIPADAWDLQDTVDSLIILTAFYLFIVFSYHHQITLLKKKSGILLKKSGIFCKLHHFFFLS